MAIAFANLGTSANPDINSAADASSYANSSWTPPTAGLLFVFVFNRQAAATVQTPTISGNGITYIQIATKIDAQSTRRLTLFGANLTGATAGATTIDYATVTQTGCVASFFYCTGADLSGGVAAAFVQSPSATGTTETTGTVTLAAAGNAANRPISCFYVNLEQSVTHRANWTEVDDFTGSAPARGFDSQYRDDAFETTATATWTTGDRWIGIAAEIKATVAAGGGNPWYAWQQM